MIANSRLSLGLLGRFHLVLGGRPVELAPAEQSLVALVALRGPQQRTQAAGTLWPNLPERRALACLRTGVWRLGRRGLPLAADGGNRVGLPDDVVVDVHGIPAALARWWATRQDMTGAARWELLPGWYQDWVLMDRERIRQQVIHGVEAGARSALAAGDPGTALGWAWQAVDLGPLRESAHRLVIAAHLAAGDVGEARAHAQRVRRLFAEELGVAPSRALTALLAGDPVAGGDPAADQVDVAASTRLLSRT